MNLQVVSQSLRALHPDQHSVLELRAEAHGQPVCPGARPVVGRPGVRDEGSSPAEDVRRPSYRGTREGEKKREV